MNIQLYAQGRFIPEERTPPPPVTHRIGGSVDNRTGMDNMDHDSNSDPSAVQPAACRYTDSVIQAPK
jgi:hypothetical protein